MSRFLVVAATLTLGLMAPTGTVLAQAPGEVASARPADAATRASYDRSDALSRSIFWATENQINPMDPIAGVKQAQALRELGQYDQSAQVAQTVLTLQPQNLEAMLEIGRAHIARGQAFYGIEALEQARATAPRDWRPLSLLGVAYQQVRRSEDAQVVWAEGLRLSPDNPNILTNSAMARMGNGDLTSAESLLRRAANQPGASLKVRQNLALTLGLQGKLAEAEQILRRDQPPEVADANLRWLSDRLASQSPTTTIAQPISQAATQSTNQPRAWPAG